jgi:hypothetical protein
MITVPAGIRVLVATKPGSAACRRPTFADPLTEVLRTGARALLAQAVEAEVATLLSRYADETTDDGRQQLVRHGHLPEREIMTGIGPVAVRCPRVRGVAAGRGRLATKPVPSGPAADSGPGCMPALNR